ncbi:MAG: hypothetical protein RIM23_09485 [Coleofasciculus sp. G3-WIS-01]
MARLGEATSIKNNDGYHRSNCHKLSRNQVFFCLLPFVTATLALD